MVYFAAINETCRCVAHDLHCCFFVSVHPSSGAGSNDPGAFIFLLQPLFVQENTIFTSEY